MKLVFFLLFISFIFCLSFIYAFRQTVTNMQNCLDKATLNTQADLDWLSESQKTIETMCDRAKTQYTTLSACYRDITRYYFIPTTLVETIMVRTYHNYPVLSRNQAFLNRACP